MARPLAYRYFNALLLAKQLERESVTGQRSGLPGQIFLGNAVQASRDTRAGAGDQQLSCGDASFYLPLGDEDVPACGYQNSAVRKGELLGFHGAPGSGDRQSSEDKGKTCS